MTTDENQTVENSVADEEFAAAYERTWRRVANAILVWNEFIVIYGSKDNLQLVNATAPTFFRIIEDALWQEVNLEISRLTDKLKIAGDYTDSLRYLVHLIRLKGMKSEAYILEKELDNTISQCRPIRDRRDQFLAHSDLNPENAPFIPLSEKDNTDNALSEIVKFMDSLTDRLGLNRILYDQIGISLWGANSLIVALRKAQASGIRTGQLVQSEVNGRIVWKKSEI